MPELQKDPKTLGKIYIRSPSNGQMVPLSAFAKWTTVPSRRCRSATRASSRR